MIVSAILQPLTSLFCQVLLKVDTLEYKYNFYFRVKRFYTKPNLNGTKIFRHILLIVTSNLSNCDPNNDIRPNSDPKMRERNNSFYNLRVILDIV